MFTGIVEEKGQVVSFKEKEQAWELQVEASAALKEITLGDSIAVNGCCLTVTRFDERSVTFDVLAETKRLTNFDALQHGDPINLERSLRFNGKLGGHFVTGHIDGQGRIEILEQRGPDYYLRVEGGEAVRRLVVLKGSVALDGVALTIAEVEEESFAVWLIPTTMEVTNLGHKRAGDFLNVEFDLLGKYVDKLTVRA